MFTTENSELFSELALEEALRIQARKIKGTVYSISSEEFRRRPNESIIEGVLKTLDIEPLVFHSERRDTDTEMIMLSRSEPGYRITVSVPYTGERRLWFFKPQGHNLHFPKGQINATGHLTGGIIKLIAQQSSHLDLDPLNQAIERESAEINRFVGLQRQEIRVWRIQLAAAARREVMERREALGEAPGGPVAIDPIDSIDRTEQLRQVVHQEISAAQTTTTPVGEQASTSEPDSVIALEPSKKAKPVEEEPGRRLTSIEIVESESRVFEELPRIYSQHSDEELRDILLAHLNRSTAKASRTETFQTLGKTNFVLPGANGAKLSPLVGGCLTWKGPAALKKRCDQLLKRSGGQNPQIVLVVLFRRSGDFNRALHKVPDTLVKHARFKREEASDSHREWTFVVSSPTDGESEVTVRALSVELPAVAK